MIDLDLARLIAAKGGRPLGVFIALGTLFLPSALLVYLTRPDFYARYGIVGGIFFGAAVGFPMVWVCCWPWYVVLWAGLKQERITKRLPEAFRPGPKPPEPSLLEQATAEDPLEWPTLVMGAWLANGVLLLPAAPAGRHALADRWNRARGLARLVRPVTNRAGETRARDRTNH